MSAEKRKVSTDALETLGTIIEDGGRDAIHLAVEPVIAGQDLKPGNHVGLRDGKAFKFSTKDKTPIKLVGIVDPFLNGNVLEGKMFWLIVYPRQITSLRHVWEHPDFAPVQEKAIEKDPLEDKWLSEKWLRDFCMTNDCPAYDTVMREYLDGAAKGDYFYFGGEDAHGSIPDEFWDHMEVVTGKKIKHRPEYFSCSC